MVAGLLHPLPAPIPDDGRKFEERKEALGKLTLACVTASSTPAQPHQDALLEPTMCFDSATAVPRITYVHGGEALIRNGVGTFQGLGVAINLVLRFGEQEAAAAEVKLLQTEAINPKVYVAGAGMEKDLAAIEIPGSALKGNLAKKVPPVYPEAAKHNRIAGSVVLHAVIGPDGHVQELLPLASPDPSLTKAALEAVRQWVYTLYQVNGKAAPVYTTITVNFAFSRT